MLPTDLADACPVYASMHDVVVCKTIMLSNGDLQTCCDHSARTFSILGLFKVQSVVIVEISRDAGFSPRPRFSR